MSMLKIENKMYGLLDEFVVLQLKTMIDSAYYFSKNEDVRNGNIEAFHHYMHYGWTENRESVDTNIVFKHDDSPIIGKSNFILKLVKDWLSSYFAKQLGYDDKVYRDLVGLVKTSGHLQTYANELAYEIPREIICDHFILNCISGTISHFPSSKTFKDIAKKINSKERVFNSNSSKNDFFTVKEHYNFPLMLKIPSYSELSFKLENYIVVVGWILDERAINEINVIDLNNNVIATLLSKDCFRREDVKALYPKYVFARDAGMVGIFKCLKTELPYELNDCVLEVKTQNCMYRLKIENVKNATGERRHIIDFMTNLWVKLPTPIEYTVTKSFLLVLKSLLGIDDDVETDVFEYGQLPSNPSCTVIVPLYGRFDFMRYQLSNFSRFGCLKNAEIIYIVDDPRIAEQVQRLATEVFKLFQIPFKLILLERNVGYGRANNIAVQFSNSDNLILLNSDVLPMNSDWDSRLVSCLEQTENVGLVGVRLLFEDGSIQHDGMAQMELDDFPGLKFNDHPKKGWPSSMVNTPKELTKCEMVTAACVAIKKSLFIALEGFDSDYLLGDFEDSDLCQKALSKGYVNYIARDIELFHLERQSQNLTEPGDWKFRVTLINAHTFNHKWC
jgi:O-antigen biosynthesis protein